ncbi:hypothetical protein KJ657_01375 [Patescibacteria group bacterium]|nr:hypothetical protein [Patescibacteria group bacterium]MBU1015719.1 hypothetical protein [Patescibacteria group bacterium]MBU1684891.1 hypothetical protein [Patescibacteria group bacterium]MBU1938651.1 hypothetical protein [Patescibacteria group bacterium]
MSQNTGNSVPPSGEKHLDPYSGAEPDGDDEMLFVRAVDFVRRHKMAFLVPVTVVAVYLLHRSNVVDWRVLSTMLAIVGIALLYYKSKGKEGALTLAGKHKKKLVLLLLVGPFAAPWVFTYYGKMFFADYNRLMDPPRVYYDWNVDPKIFDQKGQKLLKQMDPDGEDGGRIRGAILAAARMIGVEADRLSPYHSAALEKGEKFTLIIFESVEVTEVIPPPPPPEDDKGKKGNKKGEESKSAEPTIKKRPMLLVYFITSKEVEKQKEGGADAGVPKPKSKALFSIVVKEAPNLQINFWFLARGFSDSSGKEIDLQGLDAILNRPAPSEPVPSQEGPG